MSGALQGITVLDLSRVLAGPFCTMILGDLGAEVIKVEGTETKDDTRAWGPPFAGGESAYYLCANRNKQAIALNLKTPKGVEAVKRLAAEADIVVQNFKTGTLDKMGLGYDVLKQINPRIILASITGFGTTGPYQDDPGYDYIIQAMSGLMSITGDAESGPLKVGVAIADVLTGLYTVIGILAALHERDYSGVGQQIDISLFDSQMSALVNVASNYLMSQVIPQPLGNHHPNIVPYQTFTTLDGEMVVAVGNDKQFAKFADVLRLPGLASDERFQTNASRLQHKEELLALIGPVLREESSADWHKKLREAGIPCGPINNLEAVFADPQVAAREMLVHMAHPSAGTIKLVGNPLKLSRTPVEMRRHPPLYGEHTEQVLTRLGFTPDERDEMRREGVCKS